MDGQRGTSLSRTAQAFCSFLHSRKALSLGHRMRRDSMPLLILLLLLPCFQALRAQDVTGYGRDHPDWQTAMGLWREFCDEFCDRFYREIHSRELNDSLVNLDPSEFGARFRGLQSSAGDPSMEDTVAGWSGHARMSPYEVLEYAIPAVAQKQDPFSGYISSRDSRIIEELRLAPRGNVGMTLERNGENELVCYPYPSGAAEQAGLRFGDVLLAVDGEPMQGASHWEAALSILGDPGTDVEFLVRHANGQQETVSIKRVEPVPSQIEMETTLVGVTLKVRNFQEGAAQALRSALNTLEPGKRLTIDLRANQGGELQGAVLAASLFLPESAPIGYLEKRDGKQSFVSGNPVFYEAGLITLVVDGKTASGAELFAAALLAAPDLDVLVYGGPTYGKAVVVERVRLPSGGFLDVTSGRLLDPKGRSWNATGIATGLADE